ncbi:MAG: hypothetical protein NTZ01_06515, partial [Verrucomicrobia bacterium]|nr:hypothetical protein [Verrucomicrobiota bacterium]
MFILRPAIEVWILLSSSLILAGWSLSLPHQLSPLGYGLWLVGSALILAWYWHQLRSSAPTRLFSLARLRTRLRRFLPTAFLALTLLALIAGLIYEPNNHDGLSYRIPRVLHWLTHGGWFWTGNSDTRMDTRSVGFEFLSAPFLALLHTDRLIFLWNWTGFLFLPALIFQLSRRLGASGRVAWNWMWLLPSAYGIVLQAGSIGNDSIAGVFFLASLVLATGRRPVPFRDLALSAVAMAICAGIKSTNVLWGLPWLCVILPKTKTLLRRPWLTTCLLLICLALSSFPIWLSNQLHYGDWSGEKAEATSGKPSTLTNPAVGIAGNLILLSIQNSVPPIWPFVPQTSDFVRSSLPAPLVASLSKSFEGGFQDLGVRELPGEEGAGLGLGLTILSLLALFAAIGARPWKITPPSPALGIAWLATLVSILVYSSKMAIGCPARIILPALMFLILGFSALPNQGRLVRSRIWRWSAFFAMGSSLLVLILTPSRPLFPQGLMVKLAQRLSLPPSLNERIFNVYETYGRRARAFSPLLAVVPPSTRILGYTGGVALEAA